jgi:hypothetical protein
MASSKWWRAYSYPGDVEALGQFQDLLGGEAPVRQELQQLHQPVRPQEALQRQVAQVPSVAPVFSGCVELALPVRRARACREMMYQPKIAAFRTGGFRALFCQKSGVVRIFHVCKKQDQDAGIEAARARMRKL